MVQNPSVIFWASGCLSSSWAICHIKMPRLHSYMWLNCPLVLKVTEINDQRQLLFSLFQKLIKFFFTFEIQSPSGYRYLVTEYSWNTLKHFKFVSSHFKAQKSINIKVAFSNTPLMIASIVSPGSLPYHFFYFLHCQFCIFLPPIENLTLWSYC